MLEPTPILASSYTIQGGYLRPSYTRTPDGYYRFFADNGSGGVGMYISNNGRDWSDAITVGGDCPTRKLSIDCGPDGVIWGLDISSGQQIIYKGVPDRTTVPYTYTFEQIILSTSLEYYGNVTVNQADPNYVILGFRQKQYITRDGGQTWEQVLVGNSSSTLSTFVWVNENRIISASYNYSAHDLFVYAIDFNGTWTSTLIGTIDTVNYCANSDIDIDDEGNVYIMYLNQGPIVVRRFHHSDFSTYIERTFTSIANAYQFNLGMLVQRKSGEFIAATYSADDSKLHFYYTRDRFDTVIDLGIAVSSSTSIPNFAHHRVDDAIIPILYLNGGSTYSLRWMYDDTIQIRSNNMIANEIIERDFMEGGSISFDGLDDGAHIDRYVQIQTPVNTISTNWTVEYWVYWITGHRWYNGILSNNTSGPQIYYFGGAYVGGFSIVDDGTRFDSLLNLTGSYAVRTSVLPYSVKNSWHHFAITYDGENLIHYLDGIPTSTFPVSGYLRTGTNKMSLGYYTTYWMEGKMSELRIWNITRTQEEISRDMKIRLKGNEDGLIFYMPLNDGEGDTVKEIVNGNNGTLINTSWSDKTPPIPTHMLTRNHELITSEFIEGDYDSSFNIVCNGIHSCDVREHYPTDIVTDGLVLWLDGDDFSNVPQTTKWVDRSGMGNHAIASGFAYTQASGSDGFGGVALDGTDDWVYIDTTQRTNEEFTLCMHISPTDFMTHPATEGRTLFSTSHLNDFTLWARIRGGKLYINAYSDTYVDIMGANYDISAYNNTPVHIAISAKRTGGTDGRLYLNGEHVLTFTCGTTLPKYNRMYIGDLRDNRNVRYKGKIYSVQFYNRALSADEILKNYNAEH